jgi:hypothetical protein
VVSSIDRVARRDPPGAHRGERRSGVDRERMTSWYRATAAVVPSGGDGARHASRRYGAGVGLAEVAAEAAGDGSGLGVGIGVAVGTGVWSGPLPAG